MLRGKKAAGQRLLQRCGLESGIRAEPPSQAPTWRLEPYDRKCEREDGCWESDGGSGVCRDLPTLTSNSSTVHHACDGDPGCAKVAVRGTHKTCSNRHSLGYEGVEGQGGMDVNECVLWLPRHLSQRRGANLCACPCGFVSAVEDGKSFCRIEMCGVAPIGNHVLKNEAGTITAWTCRTLHVRRGSQSPACCMTPMV